MKMNQRGIVIPLAAALIGAAWAFVGGMVAQRKVNGQSKPQPDKMAAPSNFYGPQTPQK